MLEYNRKEFRNLEDQVGYLTAAFNSGKLIDELGIKVLGVFPALDIAKDAVRPPYEYGDAFAIGTEAPYNLYIYTRDIEDFFDFGKFNQRGPVGPVGPAADIQINAEATNTTGTPEVEVSKTGTNEAPVFNFKFKNLKGERGQTGMQGLRGFTGPIGPVGPIGPKGNTGPKGDVGPAFKLLGDLTSTSQLPSPTAELQAQGAAYTIPNAQGVKHIWVIQGIDNLLWTDIGKSGVQGQKGDPGDGINSLKTVKDIGAPSVTYNTTNGITINGTERYTYITAGSGAEVDVSTEKKIPLIAGEGISIDATSGADKAVIKSLSSNISNGTGTGSLVQTHVISSSGTPYNNIASGPASISLGKNTKAQGNTDFVIGQNNTDNSSGSFVGGSNCENTGNYAFVFGRYLNNTQIGAVRLGSYNKDNDYTAFSIGIGDVDHRENGLEYDAYTNTLSVPTGNILYGTNLQGNNANFSGEVKIGKHFIGELGGKSVLRVGSYNKTSDVSGFEVDRDGDTTFFGKLKSGRTPTEDTDVVRKMDLDSVDIKYLKRQLVSVEAVVTLKPNGVQSTCKLSDLIKNLYKHNIHIYTGTGGLYEVYLTVYSSKNISVDSVADLKTLPGNTFTESCTGNHGAYAITQDNILFDDGTSASLSTFNISDTVTTI